MVATGWLSPQFEVVSVLNRVAETLPKESVTSTDIWYVPAMSGTNPGVSSVGARLAALFAGCDSSVQCQRQVCAAPAGRHAALASVGTAESVIRSPASNVAGAEIAASSGVPVQAL